MYQYSYPHPIVIDLGYNTLSKNKGYLFRKEAFDYVKKNKSIYSNTNCNCICIYSAHGNYIPKTGYRFVDS